VVKCSVCNTWGANMRKCEKCNNVWSANCARQGKGHYPKTRAANVCPYCGKSDSVKPFN
jgi:hypothetical protein